MSNLAFSPAVHEAAYHPPSDGELLYEADAAECVCHLNPPCDFCCSLNEVESDIYTSRGIAALRLHWNQVAELRVDLLSVGY